MTDLMSVYEAKVAAGDIIDSEHQRFVVQNLQSILHEVEQSERAWFFSWGKRAVRGLYLYGPVGTGKTFLMDLFYDEVPPHHKARFHFHHFMKYIDTELRRLQGSRDPVRQIARALALSSRIICLDECLVHDIADAMIFVELLPVLFSEGVILIMTSNTVPDDLYLEGVHRERFLPAIALIKEHCQILELDDHRDYRVGRKPSLQAYYYPLNETTRSALEHQFEACCPTHAEGVILSIQNRTIPSVSVGGKVVWFSFQVLCRLPRSQLDYIEIAERFNTVFLSELPVISPDDTVSAILLIHLIHQCLKVLW
ncbi:MAG: cell division protein ZapE [Legionellaceae bacterium]